MQVHYSKPFGAVMLVLGIINLGLALVLASLRAPYFGPVIPGVVCVLASILYLTRTYFSVSADTIVVYALLGPLKKEYQATGQATFEREGKKVFLNSAGQRKKVGVTRFMADKADWDAFIKLLDL